MMNRRWLFLLLLLSLLCAYISGQKKMLSLDDVFHPQRQIDFDGNPPSGLRWLADSSHYLQPDAKSKYPQWNKVDAVSGTVSIYYSTGQLLGALKALAGFDQNRAQELLTAGNCQWNNTYSALVIEYQNDLFYCCKDKVLRLTNDGKHKREVQFSPDDKWLSFVCDHNLCVVEIATQSMQELTTDGDDQLLNGLLDWVYQEELYGRGNFCGYWWNPNSRQIAYLQLDTSGVTDYSIIDHIADKPKIITSGYPQAGDANPQVRIGVVDIAASKTHWVNTSSYAEEILIVRVAWNASGDRLLFQVQNREQTWLDLQCFELNTRELRLILRETSKAWIEALDDPLWLTDGSFVWRSERDGFAHLYHYDLNGKLRRRITAGSWDVRYTHGVDANHQLVYFAATAHSPTASHIYRIGIDGSNMERITQRAGSHYGKFSPDFRYFIDYWSDVTTPKQVRLHKSDGAVIRVIDANRVAALNDYQLSKPQFMQVKTRDGFVMEAMLIKPPDFDAGKKYPVLCYVYGGPQAPKVRNAWDNRVYMWHQLLAQRGYLIWYCDNRTASSKGVQSAWPLYRNFGKLELRDIEDGVKWLSQKSFVDKARIGIWGWSYGGYMTLYAMTHSKTFRMGISGAPVSDWLNYDTIYTERYMQMPQNNPAGYKNSSPIHKAKDLHGRLLLIHGTIDDNVHLQNTLQFSYALQKAGRQFQMMLYPRSRHGIRNRRLKYHMYTMMTEFVLSNL